MDFLKAVGGPYTGCRGGARRGKLLSWLGPYTGLKSLKGNSLAKLLYQVLQAYDFFSFLSFFFFFFENNFFTILC